MNLIASAYGLIAFGLAGIAFSMAKKNTGPGQKPQDIAVRTALFVVVFGFFVYIVPLMFDAAVGHIYTNARSSITGQIIESTIDNGSTLISSLIGQEITLPEMTAPALPAQPAPQAQPVAPAPVAPAAPVQRVWGNAPAPVAPAVQSPAQSMRMLNPAPTAVPTQSPAQSMRMLNPAPTAVPTLSPGGAMRSLLNPGGGPQAYTVQSGDTLFTIAVQYYGDGNRSRDICHTNAPIIGNDCNSIRPGMMLLLP